MASDGKPAKKKSRTEERPIETKSEKIGKSNTVALRSIGKVANSWMFFPGTHSTVGWSRQQRMCRGMTAKLKRGFLLSSMTRTVPAAAGLVPGSIQSILLSKHSRIAALNIQAKGWGSLTHIAQPCPLCRIAGIVTVVWTSLIVLRISSVPPSVRITVARICMLSW